MRCGQDSSEASVLSKITVQNVEKSYGGEELFSALSFEAQPGMRLAIAGPNGSGKSTLLRILASRGAGRRQRHHEQGRALGLRGAGAFRRGSR